MKTPSPIRPVAWATAGAMALVMGALTWAGGSPAAMAAEPGLLDKVQDWQNKMSDKFRDTWKNLRKEGKPSVVSASVDLREQEHSYVVRLDLPERDLDKVEINLTGDALHILAPEADKLGRYEQTIVLAGAVPDAKPVIERKKEDGVITVTVPKVSKELGPVQAPAVPDIPWVAASPWERDVLRQMNDLQRGMDRIFEDAFRDVPRASGWENHFDQPRFGSFIDLKEEGSNYVVTAYLPERDVKNASAVIEGKVLKIEALAEDSSQQPKDGENATVSRKAYYSQQLTLPGEVQADKMNIERKEGILKVTVPKAG